MLRASGTAEIYGGLGNPPLARPDPALAVPPSRAGSQSRSNGPEACDFRAGNRSEMALSGFSHRPHRFARPNSSASEEDIPRPRQVTWASGALGVLTPALSAACAPRPSPGRVRRLPWPPRPTIGPPDSLDEGSGPL